jgi:CHASE3 domain sensor protein
MVVASGLLAVVVGAAFAFLLVAIADLRDSGRLATHSRQELSAAEDLEKLVIDLETGLRGFQITGDKRFLQPWSAARAAFPGQAERLARAADDPEQARRARGIVADGTAYIEEYSIPLVNATRRGESSARSVETTDEGKRRVDALRRQFDGFAAAEGAILTSHQARADADARRAIFAGLAGVVGSIALIALFTTYLTRTIVLPVRRAAAMVGRLAKGDLSTRMPETGVGEVGALERRFNTMAGSPKSRRRCDAWRRSSPRAGRRPTSSRRSPARSACSPAPTSPAWSAMRRTER